MIESLILTALVTYTVTTLNLFNSYLNFSYSQAKIIHATNLRFEVEQAERIIRQDAENLAREIENLTKKDVPKVVNTGAIKRALTGFENQVEIYALTTSCYSFAGMHKVPPRPYLTPEKIIPINYSNNN